MQVITGKSYYTIRQFENLKDMLRQSCELFPDKPAFKFKRDLKGKSVTVTYTEFSHDIDCLGTALCHLGLKGSNIAVIGENRYEWALSYLSIVNGTGVAVPVDKMLPENEYSTIIERSKATAVIYSPSYHESFKSLAEKLSDVTYFICMDKPDENHSHPEDTCRAKFLYLPDLINKGNELIESCNRVFLDATIDNDAMCSLIFTSGTTSTSKGVMLSHKNIASDIRGISQVVKINDDDVALSVLPLHHTFENTCGLLTMLCNGGCIAICDGLRHISSNLVEYKVSVMVGVPLLFENIYTKIIEQIKKQGMLKKFKLAVRLGDIVALVSNNARRRIMKSVLDKLGGRLRLCVSGAAAIDPEVSKGFEKIGVRLVQGYGLTETSPVICGCNDFIQDHGSCGVPVPGAEITIDTNTEGTPGEILVRGPMVMLGYYEDPEATRKVLSEDGWLRTGDLGLITEDGNIKITGRVKSMIVLKNGKKVFPEEVEMLINKTEFIKESMVWGETDSTGEVEICAHLVIDKEELAKNFGKILEESMLKKHLDQTIKSVNHLMPTFKTIRYYIYSFEELTKTTTLKVKRYIEIERIRNLLSSVSGSIKNIAGKNIDTILQKFNTQHIIALEKITK